MDLYLLTLQKALRGISPLSRTMKPGMVWFMLVPCVNFVWQFQIDSQVPKSLRNEFPARGQDDRSDYGRGIASVGGAGDLTRPPRRSLLDRSRNGERAAAYR